MEYSILHFGTVYYHFQGHQDENLKMVSQQYRAWLDCTDVQAGLALYWWESLITFGVGRIRVKYTELSIYDISSYRFNIRLNILYTKIISRIKPYTISSEITLQSIEDKFLFLIRHNY